jgi:hypothetical protein
MNMCVFDRLAGGGAIIDSNIEGITSLLLSKDLPQFPHEGPYRGLITIRQIVNAVHVAAWNYQSVARCDRKSVLDCNRAVHAAKILEPSNSQNGQEFIGLPSGALSCDGIPENVVDPR